MILLISHWLSECFGEVSERFKELVLKTSDPERDRGFESHPLRHEFNTEWQAISNCADNYS